MSKLTKLDDGELDEQKCTQKIEILPGPTKNRRNKRIDELHDDELDEFYCNCRKHLSSASLHIARFRYIKLNFKYQEISCKTEESNRKNNGQTDAYPLRSSLKISSMLTRCTVYLKKGSTSKCSQSK